MDSVEQIAPHFMIPGLLVSSEPYGSGHINDTYAAVYDQGGVPIRYIHQRINSHVFKEPVALMDNVRRVTEHLRGKLREKGVSDSRAALTLVPARDGECYYGDPDGNVWRTYVFIEKARTYDTIGNTTQAFEAAAAFGRFQSMLTDLPGPRLHETVPGFHHTRFRFQAFQAAVEADACNRAARVRPEIEFVLARESDVDRLLDLLQQGLLPERTTHNDTKLNNVMIDDATSRGICVIDLDTVMPGSALYDFGDMVRTATNPAAEDELDTSKVCMRMPMFEAIARGYLSEAGEFLVPRERELLPFAGKLITFEIGLRFLTDHLVGDTYFKTRRDGHNLDRCRTQFKLVESIEAQEEAMNRLVASL